MILPVWPETRPLSLDDKSLLDVLLRETQPSVSEFTFCGLYLFRHAHRYELSCHDECLIVIGKGYDSRSYAMMPIGKNAADCAVMLLDAGWGLYGVEENIALLLNKDGRYEMVEGRDDCDYLYLREELATLPGNRYHKKKNRINYFTSRHEYGVDIFSAGHGEACLKLLDLLQSGESDLAHPSFLMELNACREALVMAEKLGLEGVVITVDGDVRAFALGERLNTTTSVCHFEKGDPFLEGIMQLINREFCRLLFTDCLYINREQDLGVAGLRNAKLSYHPIQLVKKYRLSLK